MINTRLVFVHSCCVTKKSLEVCAKCNEFPCPKFEGFDASDSFVTHQKSVSNLNLIKEHGIAKFIKQQKKRVELLETMLEDFDEGRSKGFYCLTAALLPITDMESVLKRAKKEKVGDVKARSTFLKGLLGDFAAREGIELKLRKG